MTYPHPHPSSAALPGSLWQALVEHTPTLTMLLSPGGAVRYVSPSVTDLLGHAAATLLTEFTPHLHASDLPHLRACLQRAHTDTHAVRLSPFRVRHALGHWVWLEGSLSNLTAHPDVGALVVQVQPTQDRVQALERVEVLLGITAALSGCVTPGEAIHAVLHQGLRALGADAGGVLLLSEAGQHLELAGQLHYPDDIVRMLQCVPLDAPLLVAEVARDGRARYYTERQYAARYPHLQGTRPDGARSAAALPLVVQGRVIGAVGLTFHQDRTFSSDDQTFMETLAHQCAQAIDRTRLAQLMEQRTRRERTLTQYSTDVVTILGLDGTLLYCSPSVARVIGLNAPSLNEVLARVHPEDHAAVLATYHAAAEQPGATLQVTYRFRHGEGHWVWLEAHLVNQGQDPTVGGIVITTHDVTAREQSTELLARSEAAFQQLFTANPLPMWVFDRQTLRFLAVNDAAIWHYGYPREAFLNMRLTDIRAPEEHDDLQRRVEELELTSGLRMYAQHRLRTGARIDVQACYHQLDFGGVPAAFGVIEDVTAQRAAQRALEDSEQRYRLLSENAPSLIRRFRRDGACVYASSAARTLLGHEPSDLIGLDVCHTVHPDDLPGVMEAAARAFEDPSRFEPQTYRMRRQDGTHVWVETTMRAIIDPNTNELLEYQASTVDISARQAAEAEVQEQLRRYRDLLSLTGALEQPRAPECVAQEALERCLALTEYTHGYVVELKGEEIVTTATRGGDAAAMQRAVQRIAARQHLTVIREALRAQQPFFAEQHAPTQADVHAGHFPNFCLLPLTGMENMQAALVFVRAGQDTGVREETRSLLTIVADRVRHAFERSMHLQDLQVSRHETLRALGLALEYRDYETKGHTDRVLRWTERLGTALGVRDDDLDALRWGALLHDTGKVAMPDGILLKPGRLTPEEFEVIKRHPVIGFEMLEHIPSLPATTLDVVLYHQERWNGSGYPTARAGHDIPLAARIFAVVDVYDALTSERPYKHAWTHEAATEQLRADAGVLLDPQIVEAFLALFDPVSTA
ncbi:PAS domain S-box protein [Deinococcus maricopensis]|uniref:Putative PAS/PAC sensor protein n=1 Tax=Deinococcus maricopensis (strain DSM 21211 / LMG 22137 / NRRL B-23946 / LB-34) TaxID=709986 RepID=E8UAH7_DEIML|nr:PAS domain S-box protein [Deinococcus maricopensis]ADV68066.1 putative PAS/PAC sensor protein [Deinococcus maricopensis DSM 21211]